MGKARETVPFWTIFPRLFLDNMQIKKYQIGKMGRWRKDENLAN